MFDSAHTLKIFYDLDTPVTLASLSRSQAVPYLPAEGLSEFDLVLSYTGGAALSALQLRLGARRVAPLYGHVDPELHRPTAPCAAYRADMSYLGTYAPDRQNTLERLFIAAAHERSTQNFLIGGAQYPLDFPWGSNIGFVSHVPPSEHPAFFCSSRLTLNVTRAAMAHLGWCPSGRLFEAAACGTPIISDVWDGLDSFFTPGAEILTATGTGDVLDALALDASALQKLSAHARERTLDEHSSHHRALELLAYLNDTRCAGPTHCALTQQAAPERS